MTAKTELTARALRETLERTAAYTMKPAPEHERLMDTWQWGQGVALYGLVKAHEALGDPTIPAYVEQWLDSRLERGGIGKSINTTAPLLAALNWMRLTGGDKYDEICGAFADWCLAEAPRSVEGAFEHSCTENVYPNEIWADTLFMGCLFLAQWGKYTGSGRYVKESARQFLLHYKYLSDPATGLIHHGYYGSEGARKGVLWGRGNGWFAAASAEVLADFAGLPEYEAVLDHFARHAQGAAATQNEEGAWHTVMNDTGTYAEMSATAAFAFAYHEGSRKGYLPSGYRSRAHSAVRALLANVADNGRIDRGSDGTCVMPGAADYNAIPYRYSVFTQGLGLMALSSEYALAKDAGL
ncbi:glycoside hydrolase family 105 protein [Cohnella sp. CFH 77786]|uniref:glycoside hydrolase family 88/105 protein n=1 Tax=Cohnella sp. CFH 77786 TaxID=2662265 RepID=UPI001C609113|nr:glycoside hydrolase family 88 protein [Cohnella sp. CFH 77786]